MSFDKLTADLREAEKTNSITGLLQALRNNAFAPGKKEQDEAAPAFALIMRIARGAKIPVDTAPTSINMSPSLLDQMANGTVVPHPYKMVDIVIWVRKQLAAQTSDAA